MNVFHVISIMFILASMSGGYLKITNQQKNLEVSRSEYHTKTDFKISELQGIIDYQAEQIKQQAEQIVALQVKSSENEENIHILGSQYNDVLRAISILNDEEEYYQYDREFGND